MKLLILTQVMDQKDSSLGFFQKWVAMLASKFEHIEVVFLKEGEHHMPANVSVHSLGKEFGRNRFKYILLFYYFIIKYSRNYDAVFVHMNQEYVLLGGLLWKILGKKVFMWRNHYAGSIFTDIAVAFCDKVFCTSRFSYTARFKKTVLMPVGVDEQSVHLDEHIDRIPRSILFLGRLDISKRPDLLLEALGILAKQGIEFTATFAGGPSDKNSEYPAKLHAQAEALNITDRIVFVGAVPNTETYRYYRAADIFVNCSKSGMFDKTIFKAIACGCLVLATSRDFADLVGQEFVFPEHDAMALAAKLKEFLALSPADRAQLLGILASSVTRHRLPVLVERLAEEMA